MNDVGAGPTPNGLPGEVNGLGAAGGGDCGAAGGAVVAADGANENGEFGDVKIEGIVGCGGAGAGGGAAGGLVKGSGYCGMVLAAAENGFGEGMYCDCCGVSQSGVVGGDSGAAGDSSVCGCPGGGGTSPSATRRGSSTLLLNVRAPEMRRRAPDRVRPMATGKTRAARHAGPRHGARVAIVRARWNEEITLALERGAIERATDSGASVDLFEVAGSFELPAAVALLADTGRYDAVVPVSYTHLTLPTIYSV